MSDFRQEMTSEIEGMLGCPTCGAQCELLAGSIEQLAALSAAGIEVAGCRVCEPGLIAAARDELARVSALDAPPVLAWRSADDARPR